ncbi:MAG: hypothetical protein IKJ69_04840 [Clostridia bacterium]|nr:hypothetical protein [Clostridia bacterium]
MKKLIVFVSVFSIVFAFFTSCNQKQEDDTTTTIPYDEYKLTEPSYTVGPVATSERFDTGENEYQVSYYDDNGFAVKLETYRNGKLSYYILVSGADETGNATQQKYYTADGNFIAIFDNGIFFDEAGNHLTEDYVESQFE